MKPLPGYYKPLRLWGSLTGLLLAFTQPLKGETIEMQSDKVITLRVSNQEPTRITLQNYKIEDLYVHPPASGDLISKKGNTFFIDPSKVKDNLFISVQYRSGVFLKETSQDIRIEFIKKPSEPVVLENTVLGWFGLGKGA